METILLHINSKKINMWTTVSSIMDIEVACVVNFAQNHCPFVSNFVKAPSSSLDDIFQSEQIITKLWFRFPFSI
jgi:hypothetical protein